MPTFIALAGNIGSGKSNLAKVLASRLKWEAFFEPVEDNPYLTDFYQNMNFWAFHSQIFYLIKSLQYNLSLKEKSQSIIQDRSFYENAEIFAKNLFSQKIFTERDWKIYQEFYQTNLNFIKHPDVLIYLKAQPETLLQRINKRGREAEKSIDPQYIKQLNILYNDWIEKFTFCPVITINIEGTDLRDRIEEQDALIKKIYQIIKL
jgi:deoxyadenosine/deoxycytidine kinase